MKSSNSKTSDLFSIGHRGTRRCNERCDRHRHGSRRRHSFRHQHQQPVDIELLGGWRCATCNRLVAGWQLVGRGNTDDVRR